MSNLDYIDKLGVGLDDTTATDSSDVESENTDENNLSDSLEEPTDTEPKVEDKYVSEIEEFRKQIEGMEKRLRDKDEYINSLKQETMKKEEEVSEPEEEIDFWTDPEKVVSSLKEVISKQEQQMRIQNLQLQEAIYAQTVDGYYKTVKPELIKEAINADSEFAKEFNSSQQPYKVAYEYLLNQGAKKEQAEKSLRDKIRQELLEEMKVNKGKEAPPAIQKAGGSYKPSDDISEDGFASFFGISNI